MIFGDLEPEVVLVQWILKATLALLVALALDWLLRRRLVLACTTMWNATLLLLVALPIAALGLPPWLLPAAAIPALSAETRQVSPNTSSPFITRVAPSLPPATSVAMDRPTRATELETAAAPPPQQVQHVQIRELLWTTCLVVYVLGCAVALVRLFGSMRAVTRLRRSSTLVLDAVWQQSLARLSATCALTQSVELRQSDDVGVPALVGWRRPVIMLPCNLVAASDEITREAILIHELAHVVRGDFAWQLLQRAVQVVLWFHPLMRLAERRIGFIRERACDAYTIHCLGGTNDYVATLLEMAGWLTRRSSLSLGLAVLRSTQLGERLAAMRTSTGNPRCQAGRAARLAALAVALLLAGWVGRTAVAEPPLPSQRVDSAGQAAPATDVGQTDSPADQIHGHVVDAAGKPLAGAQLILFRPEFDDTDIIKVTLRSRFLAKAITEADGSFSIPRPNQPTGAFISAAADGHGLDWEWAGDGTGPDKDREFSIKLVRDEVPVEGRLLNLEGRPLPGLKVRASEVISFGTDLDERLEEARHNSGGFDPYSGRAKMLEPNGLQIIRTAITDASGKFQLTGLGPDRFVQLEIEGPGVAKTWVAALTRSMAPLPMHTPRATEDPRFSMPKCYGAKFEMALQPDQPVAGAIRDADTGKPLAGVEVRLEQMAGSSLLVSGYVAATTDQLGRYALHGLPKPVRADRSHRLRIIPAAGQPYFRTEVDVPHRDGLGTITCDVGLKRALLAHGQVTDATTGQPVVGFVAYFPFLSNASAADYANFVAGRRSIGTEDHYATQDDGTFRIPALPGRGIVVFFAEVPGHFPLGDGADGIVGLKQKGGDARLNVYHLFDTEMVTAVREVNPVAGADFVCDVNLRPLDIVRLRFVDPDKRPIVGVQTLGLEPVRFRHDGHGTEREFSEPLPTATAELHGPGEQKSWRTLLFFHRDRRLGAVVRLKATQWAGGSMHELMLQTCGSISGRILDRAGKPASGVSAFMILPSQSDGPKHWLDSPHYMFLPEVKTSQVGRFQADLVLPGAEYLISLSTAGLHAEKFERKMPAIQPGEAVDLGEIQLAEFKTTQAATDAEDKQIAQAPAAAPSTPAKTDAMPTSSTAKQTKLSGQVVGPDGKPVAGAGLHWLSLLKVPPQTPDDVKLLRQAISDDNGRFEVTLSMPNLPNAPDELPLIAHKAGFGLAWSNIDLKGKSESQEIRLQLVEDAPVRGRVIDTEGKPVAGARISLNTVLASSAGLLDPFLTAWKQEWQMAASKMDKQLHEPLESFVGASTDPNGRFELRGIGLERIGLVEIEAPSIEKKEVWVINRPGFDPRSYNEASQPRAAWMKFMASRVPRLAGPVFNHVAETGFVITGTVFTGAERKPVPGASVGSSAGHDHVSAMTDAAGRFQLRGLPRSQEFLVGVRAADEQSDLLARTLAVKGEPSQMSVTLDVELKRGVVLTGRVLDRSTGLGVKGGVRFVPLPENTYALKAGYDGYRRDHTMHETDRDGKFRLVIIPGPGVLMAQVFGGDLRIGAEHATPYRQASFTPAERERVAVAGNGQDRYFTSVGGSIELLTIENAVKVIDSSPDKPEPPCELNVERGAAVELAIHDQQGQPLSGTIVAGVTESWPITFRIDRPKCIIYALGPDRPRHVVLLHPQRHLAGSLTLSGTETGPVTATLAPTGSITGRALDASQAPLVGAVVQFQYTNDSASELLRTERLKQNPVHTDAEGRFRIDNVIPAERFALDFQQGNTTYRSKLPAGQQQLESGQVLKLDNVAVRELR